MDSDQLRIWKLEKAIAGEPDDRVRLRLLQERLEAQRRVSLPKPPSASDLLSSTFELGDAFAALRASEQGLSSEELRRRALDEEAALRLKDEKAAGDPLKRAQAALREAPPKLAEIVTTNGLDRTAAVAAVESVRDGGTCILLGSHDAGKSTAATAGLLPAGLWISGPLLFDEWKARKRELLSAPRLVIDDFGRGVASAEQRAASAEVFETLLLKRNERPDFVTIATANLLLDGLQAALEAPRKGQPRATQRWSFAIERLREFGRPRELSEEVRRLGGSLLGPGVVLCPYEGYRQGGRR